MKKKIILSLAIIMLLAGNATPQVFLLGEETSPRSGTLDPSGMVIPELGSTNDQYLPLGSGAVLLAGLAGAYLIVKKKKK